MPGAPAPKTYGSLERIRKVSVGVGVPFGLRDDLVQEAWVRCTEYARQRGRVVEDLSNTEIRHRCYEARRVVLPPRRELVTDDVEALAPCDEAHEAALDAVMRGDLVRRRCSDAARVRFVLRAHPTLTLTDRQLACYRALAEGRRGTQAALARSQGISRQGVANTARVVRRKVAAAVDLVRLWDGDVLPFFEKYGNSWANESIQRLLWSTLRPREGVAIPASFTRSFHDLQPQLLAAATATFLHAQRAIASGSQAPVRGLARAYNLLVTAAHIPESGDRTAALLGELTALGVHRYSWILHRFIRRAAHLVDANARAEHERWLAERVRLRDASGASFAQYAITYYNGAGLGDEEQFLASDGRAPATTIDYGVVIGRLYDNLRITKYRTTPVWDDINYLRLALMDTHFPLRRHLPRTHRSWNAVRTICQRALHSPSPLVVSHAERLLRDTPTPAPHNGV